MASEQWLLNDTSVANTAYFTAVTGGSYKLQNTFGTTRNRVTSSPTPYEGAGCYASGTGNEDGVRFHSSASADLTGTSGTYYFDAYVYLPTGFTDLVAPILTGEDTLFEYSWVQPNANTSLSFGGYDTVNGVIVANTTATGKFSTNAWFRVQAKTNQYGMNEFRVFVGGNIDGASPSTTVTPLDFNGAYGHSAYQRLYGMVGNGSTYPIYIDNIKFDNAAYPTRGTAHTAAGSATGTATGTGAALRGQSVTGSASVTASGTAGMSRAQVIGASGAGTATGTSEASGAMAQTATATGTVVATSSVDFIVMLPITLQSNGTVIADSSGEMAKTMPIESTGTATATSQADATHTYYIFKPPTREISPLSLDPFYQLVGYNLGQTLVRRGGVWSLVQNKKQEYLDQSEYVFPGGRENRINGAEKTALESAGYTVETRTS